MGLPTVPPSGWAKTPSAEPGWGAVAIWAPGAPGAVQGEAKGSCWIRPRSQGSLSWWLHDWPARPYSVPTAFPIAETGSISPQVLRAKGRSHLSPSSLTLHVHPPPSPGSSQISWPVRKPPAPQLPPWAEALSRFTWLHGSLLSHLGPPSPTHSQRSPVAQTTSGSQGSSNHVLEAWCTLVPPGLLAARLSLPAGSACARHPQSPPKPGPTQASPPLRLPPRTLLPTR